MKQTVIKSTEIGHYKVVAYQIIRTYYQPPPDFASFVTFGLMLREKNGTCHFRWGIRIKTDLLEGINYFAPVFSDMDPFRAKIGLRSVDIEGNVLQEEPIWEEDTGFPWVTIFPFDRPGGLIGQVEIRELVIKKSLEKEKVRFYFKPFWLNQIRRNWQMADFKLTTAMKTTGHWHFALLMDTDSPPTSAVLGLIASDECGSPILIYPAVWGVGALDPFQFGQV